MTTLWQHAPDALSTSLEDSLVMLNMTKGSYHQLNAVGVSIWALLATPKSEADVVRALLQEYDVPEAVCAEAVATFIAGLQKRGLVIAVD